MVLSASQPVKHSQILLVRVRKRVFKPWSNISPKGPAIPVLLACFLHLSEDQLRLGIKVPPYPSIASKLWYMKSPIAQLNLESQREMSLIEKQKSVRKIDPLRGPGCSIFLGQVERVVV